MHPIRIQRSRKKKQISPNGLPILYVGRPTKYGNPFKLGEKVSNYWMSIFDKKDTETYFAKNKIIECEDGIYLFEKYMSYSMAEFKEKNQGKNLSCWCRLGEKCHADILLKLWNS